MTITNLPVEWLTLADAVLKATIIFAGAAIVSFALRRASAAFRHLLWTLALCSALAVPVLSIVLPKWQLPIITLAANEVAIADVSPSPTAPAPPEITPPSRTRQTVSSPAATVPPTAPVDTSAARAASAFAAVTWQQALFAIWLAGAAIILARMAIGLAAVRWLSRRTQEITDAPWLPMAEELAG